VDKEITKYFPDLTDKQIELTTKLLPLYEYWNTMINVISRKDLPNFYSHHLLHSLSIAKTINFLPGTTVLDVGTGGGFPGIPLAIMFPETDFFLLDSIGKKIKVVNAIATELGLGNIKTLNKRAEDENGKYDFVVSRAVTNFIEFVKLTRKNVSGKSFNTLQNGIICLKGGDLDDELGTYSEKVKIWNISDFFDEEFFLTKKIVYLPC